jgi:hypothetical protein
MEWKDSENPEYIIERIRFNKSEYITTKIRFSLRGVH